MIATEDRNISNKYQRLTLSVIGGWRRKKLEIVQNIDSVKLKNDALINLKVNPYCDFKILNELYFTRSGLLRTSMLTLSARALSTAHNVILAL
jgi:hypothetical protein